MVRVHIREANVSDAAAIAKVHVDSWRTTYTGVVPDEYLAQLSYEQRGQVWRDILSTHGAKEFVYVAEAESSNIIGFASGGPERSGNPVYKGELYAIYLLEGYQRKGIGGQLAQAIVKRLVQEGFQSMLVWVLANSPSQDFYSALGGQRVYEQEITIGEARLVEVAYGWWDIREFVP
jgi:L-amino acid N-acyltransferase YncA